MKLPFISMLCAFLFVAFPLKARTASTNMHYAHYTQKGVASWYGGKFVGRETASGERLTTNKLTVAHRFLPLGTIVKITNLRNGKIVNARVNDRGPYAGHRIVDLSKATAKAVGLSGLDTVKLEAVSVPTDEPVEVAEYHENDHTKKHKTKHSVK